MSRYLRALFVVTFVAATVVGLSACYREDTTGEWARGPAPSPAAVRNISSDSALTETLKKLCDNVGGDVSVAIVHVETGRTLDINSGKKLPLYSVFKLPLAVVVLKAVEEKRLQLDQKVRVTPEDVAPGSQYNTDLWTKPAEKPVAELLELSIVRSDNTSSDKLLELVGGPAGVTTQLRSLGFSNIDIVATVREFVAHRDRANTGSASDLARLLSRLQKAELLQPPQMDLLLGFMSRAKIGEHRLRGNLPPGTPVVDKTGTGDAGATTNDVGIITLPESKGHLAMAVFVNGAKVPAAEQEKLIADVARAAYEFYSTTPAKVE